MAKISLIARTEKRVKLIERYRKKRQAYKAQVYNISLSDEERMKAQQALQDLPRDSSPTRDVTRCFSCGRPRGVYRKFGLCRICLRNTLMQGDVPGGRKSSW